MENLPLIIYFIDTILTVDIVPPVKHLYLSITVVICIFLFALSIAAMSMEADKFLNWCSKYLKNIYKKVAVFCCLWIVLDGFGQLVPTKETAYKMIVAYGGIEIAKMDEVKQVSEKAFKALNKVIDEYIEEPTKEN